MFEREQQVLESHIRTFCAENDLPTLQAIQWSPIPFAGEWGLSTSFFQLAAQEARSGKRVNVPQRAAELATQVAAYLQNLPGGLAGFTRLAAVKGYLNLYFSGAEYTQQVVDMVLQLGADYGRGAPTGKLVMVEFSQPNTHKAFHIGHLRSAIFGDSIARILAFAGNQVVRANYIGDIGLHVIKWLWNYMKFHAGEQPPETGRTRWMGDLYAEASRRLEQDPQLESEVRAIYARWDRDDAEVVDLWQTTRQWSLDGFDELYRQLDIHFDHIYANSQVEKPGKQVVEELIAKGIAVDERPEGPVIVRIDDLLGLKQEKYRVLVVLRSDNTALYSTEDLALAKMKFNDYPLDRSLYVVDVRQSLHFQQVFKTLEIAGYEWATHCQHLPYELVNLPGNVVMASREGTVVLLEDLFKEATQLALAVVKEKNPALSGTEQRSVANKVGLGALKYPILARDNTRLVTFDWETALDFNGQAAPYIQYAHVRANSILRKWSEEGTGNGGIELGALPGSQAISYPLDPSEVQLVDLLARLPAEVQRAADETKTLPVTNLAYELARAFTDFYAACPVLKAEPEVRATRLRMVAAARQAIANLLGLLGIPAPEVM